MRVEARLLTASVPTRYSPTYSASRASAVLPFLSLLTLLTFSSMAPPSSLQERIRQFEAMNGGAGVQPTPKRDRPRPSYPPVPRVQASFINSEASSPMPDLLGEPISPTTASYTVIKPTLPYVPRKPRIKSPSPSPPNLGCNTSLIDLKDSTFDDRPEWLKESVSVKLYTQGDNLRMSLCCAETGSRTSASSTHLIPEFRCIYIYLEVLVFAKCFFGRAITVFL